MDVLEDEMLNGQKLQGPHTAYQVYLLLKDKKMEDQYVMYYFEVPKYFPLFIKHSIVLEPKLCLHESTCKF